MTAPIHPTVLWLAWRQLFAKRRLWLALGFALLPLLITVVFIFTSEDREGVRAGFFGGMCREFILGTIVPLAAAVFGTTAFGGEVDDGTLVYLLVKPIARWRVVLSKYLVATLATIAVLVVALTLPFLMLRGEDITTPMLYGFIAGGSLGAAVYCALFLTLGLASRRALVLALVYVIGFEGVLSRNLSGVKSLSIREFSISASQAASDGAIKAGDFVVPMSTAWTMSTVFFAAAMALSFWRLARYELAERV